MNGVTITTNKNYIVIKIPKKQVKRKGSSSWKKELIEDELLMMFEKGKEEFKRGKLKPMQSLSELI